MLKPILSIAAAMLATAATAQTTPATSPGAACPAGTQYATIRHNMVKPGQLAAFQHAVAAHNAWYAAHHNTSTTTMARVLTRTATGPALSQDEAVTITRYAETPQPEHDAGYAAFTAQYKDSADMKDEVRVCLPPLR